MTKGGGSCFFERSESSVLGIQRILLTSVAASDDSKGEKLSKKKEEKK